VPKFASGSTPKFDEGASTIHSAEDSVAPDWLPVVVNVHPSVTSVIVSVYVVPLTCVTIAEIVSWAFTVAGVDVVVPIFVAVVISIIDSRG